jgi:hypothetical protein
MGEMESMRGSAAIQQDHVLPVSRRWERQGQCVVRQLFSKITHLLWVGDGRYRVSAWVSNYPTRSRTSCGQAMGETESMCDSAVIQQDHILAVGGRWEIPSQCMGLQLSNKITYFLWAGNGRDSMCDSAAAQQDHVPAVGARWEIPSQWVVLQLSSKITYTLWSGDGRISGWFCSYSARSRTNCGRAMGDTESVGGSATIQQHHVLSVGRQWERLSQFVIRQLFSKITYTLWSGDGRWSVHGSAAI